MVRPVTLTIGPIRPGNSGRCSDLCWGRLARGAGPFIKEPTRQGAVLGVPFLRSNANGRRRRTPSA